MEWRMAVSLLRPAATSYLISAPAGSGAVSFCCVFRVWPLKQTEVQAEASCIVTILLY